MSRSRDRFNDPSLIKKARSAKRGRPQPPSMWLPIVAALAIGGAIWQLSPNSGSDKDLVEAIEQERPYTPPSIEPASDTAAQEQPTIAPIGYGPANPFSWSEVPILKGDTLFGAMRAHGITRSQANNVVNALTKVYDVRKIRPGDAIKLQFFGPERIVQAQFSPTPLVEISMQPYADGLTATRLELEPEIRLKSRSVKIEGSVAASFDQAGIPFAVLIELANLFAWSVDFSSGVWPGDRIDVLWEELWVKDKPYKAGRILASRFRGANQDVDVFHHNVDDTDEWYHRNGRNVKAAFLRAPVKFTRISSKFTRKRFHPVLKRYRPHSGVDFAAPTGTPVVSVADGKVIGAGVMGGAGKAVRVRHNNGWITSYSHLSRISVRKGATVRQGQRIGLVGSTGYSTGPHLDYRIKVNGSFVDPMRINLPSGTPVSSKQKPAFEARMAWLENQLEELLPEPLPDAEVHVLHDSPITK